MLARGTSLRGHLVGWTSRGVVQAGEAARGRSGPVPPSCIAFSDPAYDETRSADAADLAAHYGGAWLRAALQGRCMGGRAEHPVAAATIRHVDGSMSLLLASEWRRLEPGCLLYRGGHAHLEALHPQLPRPLAYLPAHAADWGTAQPRYLTLHMGAPGRLYVLMVQRTVEPKWLRHNFLKLREPLYGNKVLLPMRWARRGLYGAVKRLVAACGGADGGDELVVWRSKRRYQPGDVVRLGGLPSAHLTDCMYVVAAATEEEDEQIEEQGRRGPPSGLPAGETLTDWGVWLARMVKAIRRSRVEDVRALLKADAWLSRPIRTEPLTWLPPGEEAAAAGPGQPASPLTSDLAVRGGSVALLSLLVAECGCQLSYRGLRFLVHKWEEVPMAYGGAQALLLDYIRRSSRPLGPAACCLSALRAEVAARERARSSSTLVLQAAIGRMHEVQTCLLEAVAETARRGGGQESPQGTPHPSSAHAVTTIGHASAVPPVPPGLTLAWLAGVLDPRPPAHTTAGPSGVAAAHAMTLAEHSPLRIAFDDKDTRFMASVVAEEYTRQKWLRAAYLALTPRDGVRELTPLDPLLGHTLLRRLGLCDSLHEKYGAGVRASALPGGLATGGAGGGGGGPPLQPVQVAAPQSTGAGIPGQRHDTADRHRAAHRHGGAQPTEAYQRLGHARAVLRLGRHGRAGVHTVPVHADPSIHAPGPAAAHDLGHDGGAAGLPPAIHPHHGGLCHLLLRCVPHVWRPRLRLLPGRAATPFPGLFGHLRLHRLGRHPAARLPPFRHRSASGLPYYCGHTPGQPAHCHHQLPLPARPGGCAVRVRAAEVVERHQQQVEHSLLPSPFCLIQAPFNLIPRGTRPAIPPAAFFRVGLPPLEGFRPAAPHLATVPTGRDAVPALLFHLTLHPLMLLVSVAAYCLLSPFGVAYFTLHGHQTAYAWLHEITSRGKRRGGGEGGGGRNGPLAAPGAGIGSAAALSIQAGASASGALSMAGASASRGQLSSSFDLGEMGGAHGAAGADLWQHLGRHFTLAGVPRLLYRFVRLAMDAAVGGLMYGLVVGIGLMALGGLYSWAACVLLSLGNVAYEPAMRIGSLARRWRGQVLRGMRGWRGQAVVDSGQPGSASCDTSQRSAGCSGGSVVDKGGSEGQDSQMEIREWPAKRDTGGGGRPPRAGLTAAEVTSRWSQLARAAERQRTTGVRYLTQQQVEEAIARALRAHSGKHIPFDALRIRGGAVAGAAGGVPQVFAETTHGAQTGLNAEVKAHTRSAGASAAGTGVPDVPPGRGSPGALQLPSYQSQPHGEQLPAEWRALLAAVTAAVQVQVQQAHAELGQPLDVQAAELAGVRADAAAIRAEAAMMRAALGLGSDGCCRT